jgi:Ca2+-binding EF-hand superfamily protein
MTINGVNSNSNSNNTNTTNQTNAHHATLLDQTNQRRSEAHNRTIELLEHSSKPLDADNNGIVNENDMKLINRYVNGLRGNKLIEDIPYVTSQSIQAIEQRLSDLVASKLNVYRETDTDTRIDRKDLNIISSAISDHQKSQTKAEITRIYNAGGFDFNGDGKTDLNHLRALFVDKKSPNQIAEQIGGTAEQKASIVAKLEALISNPLLDINANGRKGLIDFGKIKSTILKLEAQKAKEEQRTRDNNLTNAIQNNVLDVNGDNKTDKKDFDIIKAHVIGGKTPAQIASETGINPQALTDKLNALTTSKVLDRNGDGKVSKAEIDSASVKNTKYKNEQKKIAEEAKARALVTNKTIDVNGDGKVDAADLRAIQAKIVGNTSKLAKIVKGSPLSFEQINSNLTTLVGNGSLDINGDGKTNYQDVQALKKAVNNNTDDRPPVLHNQN